jgi:hypothetical protein
MADAGGVQADKHLARPGVAKLDPFDGLRLPEAPEHSRHGLDRHVPPIDISGGE